MELFGKQITRVSSEDLAEIGVVLAGAGPIGDLNIKSYLPVVESLCPTFDKEKFLKGCKFHYHWIRRICYG